MIMNTNEENSASNLQNNVDVNKILKWNQSLDIPGYGGRGGRLLGGGESPTEYKGGKGTIENRLPVNCQ